ncbi:hypothetical protein XPA_005060 [Xanthoria parietina]
MQRTLHVSGLRTPFTVAFARLDLVYLDEARNIVLFSPATGAALSVGSRTAVRAVYALPYDEGAHWTLDRDTFGDVRGNGPMVFTNNAISGVLYLSSASENNGTPVLLNLKIKPVTQTQAWYVQCTGSIY